MAPHEHMHDLCHVGNTCNGTTYEHMHGTLHSQRLDMSFEFDTGHPKDHKSIFSCHHVALKCDGFKPKHHCVHEAGQLNLETQRFDTESCSIKTNACPCMHA